MTKNKIQVKERYRIYNDFFEGKLEDLIASFQSEFNDGWVGIEEDYEEYEDNPCYYLYRYREETDKEYEKRMRQLEKEKQDKLKAKERRRKEYEKLKKEFENETAS
jgi:hypothetical protein